MASELTHTIEIDRQPAAVYAYVTQPWRWHEWHPASRCATRSTGALVAGDTFEEEIELAPLAPLPLRLRRRMTYRVVVAEPSRRWAVTGETRDGRVGIRYELRPVGQGTGFTRTLSFETRGVTTLLMPFLQRRVAKQSVQALERLRRLLESGADG